MNKLTAILICVAVAALPHSSPLSAADIVEAATSSVTTELLKRPSASALNSILREGGGAPDNLELWVQRLDRRNLELLPRHAMEWFYDQDQAVRLIYESTQDLPRMTPMRERTLLFLLRLQPKMLEIYLRQRNPVWVNTLRQRRIQRRVLDPNRHKIFGDIRDVYIADFFYALQDIDRTFQELGSPGDPLLRFPVGLASVVDLEAFFAARIESLFERIPGSPR